MPPATFASWKKILLSGAIPACTPNVPTGRFGSRPAMAWAAIVPWENPPAAGQAHVSKSPQFGL